jgi:PAP2 superfamily
MGEAARLRYEKDFTASVGLDRLVTGYQSALATVGTEAPKVPTWGVGKRTVGFYCPHVSVVSAPPALPHSLRRPLGLIAVLAALVVAGLGVHYAGVSGGEWIAPVEGPRPPWQDLALAIEFCGEPVGAAILVAALAGGLLLLGRRRSAVLVVVAAGVTVAMTTLLKPVVDRTTPSGYLSFPSGHTALATALALVVALSAASHWLGTAAGTALVLGSALAAGAAMGWAMVALGSHYPTDTVGGFFTALAVVPATAWLLDGLWTARARTANSRP